MGAALSEVFSDWVVNRADVWLTGKVGLQHLSLHVSLCWLLLELPSNPFLFLSGCHPACSGAADLLHFIKAPCNRCKALCWMRGGLATC